MEINNTFYRLPKREMLEGWAAKVPPEFRFVLKASRRITHFKRLEGVDDETAYLLDTASAMGDRLGAVFFQLPPHVQKSTEKLAAFLATLPPVDAGPRVAFEFRHPTWFDDEIYELLRTRDAAMVFADVDGEEPPVLTPTASWGYLRLRREDYPDEALAAWRAKVEATGWQEAYVFFKHEDDCAGPEMAARFLALG